MGNVGAQKIFLDAQIVEQGCLETDETTKNLENILDKVIDMDLIMRSSFVGAMQTNFTNASGYLEEAIDRVCKSLQESNKEVRENSFAITSTEQLAIESIGGGWDG